MGVEFTDEKLVKGAELVAISRCTVNFGDGDYEPALVVGKVYPIMVGAEDNINSPDTISIESELNDKHSFRIDSLSDYFIPMDSQN